MPEVISAYSDKKASPEAAADIAEQLAGADPAAIVFFAWHEHDGAGISGQLRERFPSAEVVGCTTAGEFTDSAYGNGALAAIALPSSKVKRCAAALALFDRGVASGVDAASKALSDKLGDDLRTLDPGRHVGILLNTALQGHEEEVNEVLGHVAPLLAFVGGSAADNFELKKTRVFYNGEESDNASILLLMELTGPYAIVKTSSFEPTERSFRITRIEGRIVYELDGKPALATYAEAVGVPVDQLGHEVFTANPLGLMIDGDPWVRSPIAALPDGGLLFGCAMLPDSEMYLLRSTDLVRDTKSALEEGAQKLGTTPTAAVLFNCAHRRLEIEAKGIEAPFRGLLQDYPIAGFNCYGESYLGHINQTIIGLLIA